tara:strand:+ start:129 stop:329 length:201 start_codon:yes stop_codon:yes gene_type:complete
MIVASGKASLTFISPAYYFIVIHTVSEKKFVFLQSKNPGKYGEVDIITFELLQGEELSACAPKEDK